MRDEIETFEYLHRINKDEVFFLLMAMQECKDKGFDFKKCNIDIVLQSDLISKKNTYIFSFYPREVTANNAMEYQVALDDFNVYIDFETKSIIRSCPSI